MPLFLLIAGGVLSGLGIEHVKEWFDPVKRQQFQQSGVPFLNWRNIACFLGIGILGFAIYMMKKKKSSFNGRKL